MVLTPLEAIVVVERHFVPLRVLGRSSCMRPSRNRSGQVCQGQGSCEGYGHRLGRALVSLHMENLSAVWVDWLYLEYHHSRY